MARFLIMLMPHRFCSIALCLILGCEVVSVGSIGFSQLARKNLRAMRGPVPLLDSEAFLGQAFVERASWLVLFCGPQGAPECSDLRRELVELHDKGDSPLSEVRLAEVNCTRDAQLCQKQGFGAQLAAVVHYTEGARSAVWMSTDENGENPLGTFARWTRKNFAKNGGFVLTMSGVCDWVSKMPQRVLDGFMNRFPDLARAEVAIAVACVILLQMAIVTWVFMEGFELWPRAEKHKHG